MALPPSPAPAQPWGTEPEPEPKAQSKGGAALLTPCSGTGGWGRVTEQPQLPEQGQGGSQGAPLAMGQGRGNPQGPTRLPGELSQNLPQATGGQAESWVTVSCWQIFLLIKGEKKKRKEKKPQRSTRKETLLARKPEVWVRYRNCYCVTATGL